MSDNRKDRYCPSCGEKLQLGETHCEYCGTTYAEKPKMVPKSNKLSLGFPSRNSRVMLYAIIACFEIFMPIQILLMLGLVGYWTFGIIMAVLSVITGEMFRIFMKGPTIEFFDDGTFTLRRPFRLKKERYKISDIARLSNVPTEAMLKNGHKPYGTTLPYIAYTKDGCILFRTPACDEVYTLFTHYGVEVIDYNGVY